MTAVNNILKYLKRTKQMFLLYGGDEELVVKGYVDASFNTDPDDSKSQTGYVFILNEGAVSWCSSKQSVVLPLELALVFSLEEERVMKHRKKSKTNLEVIDES